MFLFRCTYYNLLARQTAINPENAMNVMKLIVFARPVELMKFRYLLQLKWRTFVKNNFLLYLSVFEKIQWLTLLNFPHRLYAVFSLSFYHDNVINICYFHTFTILAKIMKTSRNNRTRICVYFIYRKINSTWMKLKSVVTAY